MTKILLASFVSALLGSAPARAGCTAAAALEAPGTWKSSFEADGETSDVIPKAELPGVLKDMSGYGDLLKDALGGNPGHAAQWYRRIGGRLFGKGPAQYEVNVPLFRYECDGDKLTHEGEHSDWATVEVNSTWAMSGPAAGVVVGGKKFYSFGSPIGEIRGFPAFQTDSHGDEHLTTWVVLVEKPGRKAFHFATRQELLDSLIEQNGAQRAEAMKQADLLSVIRPQAAQEQDKQKELALFLKGAKDDAQRQHWTERFEKDYRNDEQKRDELRAKFTKVFDKILAHLTELRAQQTPEQLSSPAMSHPSAVSRADETFAFKKTHDEDCGKGYCGEGHGRPFAIPAAPYYDPAASAAKPQFFVVAFEWAQGRTPVIEPHVKKLRDDFFARFDFDRLVARLGR